MSTPSSSCRSYSSRSKWPCDSAISLSGLILRSLTKAEDVAVRDAEPCPARRADLRYVPGRRQEPIVVVDEHGAAFLESANHRLDIGQLEMAEGVICRARPAP